jgi:hypothetical protein
VTLLLPIHILAGVIGLGAGAVTLYAVKGGRVHRRAGLVFACAMLIMSAIGAGLAAVRHQRLSGAVMAPQWSSVLAGLLTFYLVTTGWLTIRRTTRSLQWPTIVSLLFALTLGLASIRLGIDAQRSPGGKLNGQPAIPGFVFGGVALLAAVGDLRVMFGAAMNRAQRLARHLWRMCFALFIAALSFFLGQAHIFPKPIRKVPLLATPVLLVLVIMVYWLIRVRLTRWSPRARPPSP